MTRYGLIIDLNRCIGCRSCAVVCKTHNSIPPGTWWQRVETVGSAEHMVPVGEYPHNSETFLPVPCMHCDNPPCVKVCPVGATWKNDEGLVLVDYERCIGCRYCMTACPYGVRQFNWQEHKDSFDKAAEAAGFEKTWAEESDGSPGYPFEHRTEGRLVYTPDRPLGMVEKCTFCVQYIEQGLEPACVRGCPGNARIFGDLDDPDSEISRTLDDNVTFRLLEELGTEPKVFYIPVERKENRGGVTYDKQV